MSAEPISDDTLVRVEEKLARMKGLDVLDGRQFSGNTVAAMLARIRALEAEVVRKDVALTEAARCADAIIGIPEATAGDEQVSSDDEWDLAFMYAKSAGDAARAALGPWLPTHEHIVEYGYGFCRKVLTTSPRRAGDDDLTTIFQTQDGCLHKCHAKTFSTAKWFRPLTPDEARAATEGRS